MSSKIVRSAVILLVALCGIGSQFAVADSAGDVKKQLTELNTRFCEALAKGDAAGMVKHCTDKTRLMPPHLEAIEGREKIQVYWQAAIDAGLKSATLEISDVEVSGDLACETGTYKVFAQGEQLIERGKYIVVWKKQDGVWKAHRDCWNSSDKRSE